MMYFFRVAFISTLIAYWTPNAVAQHRATMAEESLESCVLWKVTGRGIKPSYLFGTLHIIGEQDFVWTPYMQRAFDACKALMLEVDISQPSAYAASLQQYAPMRDGSNLSDLLSEEDYREVKTYFEQKPEYQTIFSMVQTWCPFAHMTMLHGDLLSSAPIQYDAELVKKAKVKDKTILGLSTHDTYFELMHALTYQKQAEDLAALVKDLSTKRLSVQEVSNLVQAYRAQDLQQCYTLMQKRGEERSDLYGLRIDEYNKAWLPTIVEQCKKKTTFYAVNVGHLWGEQGLIRLLQAKGYKVEPVCQ